LLTRIFPIDLNIYSDAKNLLADKANI